MIHDLHPETERIVPAAGFDVREFARTAHGSHRAELFLEAYADAPLSNDALQVIDLLARLERGALSYLRTVLVTPAHNDPRVTGFLVTWAYEKYWVADALELILAAHPAYVPSTAPGIRRLTRAWHALDERVQPMRGAVVANLIGEDVIAVHTAAGAIDEWITQAAYERLAEQTTHPGFAGTLTRLLDVKRRHATYFAADAGDRLTASPRAGRLARRQLGRMVWPLGSADEPPALIAGLLGDVVPASDLARIDARIDTFAGLDGLGLVAKAARRARKARR